MTSSAGAEINYIVSPTDCLFIVFNDEDGVA
jgi:hypothetical protein